MSETPAPYATGPLAVRVSERQPRRDARGWLLKVLMLPELAGRTTFGEIYITAAVPGAVKGNHYHRRTTEWFCVIRGRGRLVLRPMPSGQREELLLDEAQPRVVEVPPGIAHAIQNVGEGPMHLLAYADLPYDPADPDTVPVALVE